jgi:hypothetical protein
MLVFPDRRGHREFFAIKTLDPGARRATAETGKAVMAGPDEQVRTIAADV